ncbi:MAG: hypothetical protein Q7R83_00705 [bacterium]|nr:hypothetical protein [bacterium]
MEKFQRSEAGEARHHLIQKEFREALYQSHCEVSVETAGVVVLSGREFITDGKTIDFSLPGNAENRVRIEMGIEVAKQIVARKIGKMVEEVDDEALRQEAPPLILNGTPEQLPIMRRITLEIGYPLEKIQLVDCGAVNVANTKTQFEVMNNFFREKKPKHLTFISSSYHAPRVARTGDKNLDPAIDFDVLSVPFSKFPFRIYQVVRGEVKRIEAYSAKGDISAHVRRKSLKV